MMRAEITIRECEHLDLLASALRPETERDIPRTQVTITEIDDDLRITMEAEDVNALRAVVNSYSRWLKLIMDTEQTLGGT
jgi:tRNA threonylcarbamoyladenosine modification (KEOPS) complex  Pcc1 subunit